MLFSMLSLEAQHTMSAAAVIFYRRVLAVFFLPSLVCLLLTAAVSAGAEVGAHSAPTAVKKIEGMGNGAVPLDGAWQFHLGDNATWASPDIDDATGHEGWEEINADATWGSQSHSNYQGYAWYRRRIEITSAGSEPHDLALMVPAIDDVYELYWNGRPIGHLGTFPPHLDYFALVPPHTYGLGPAKSGVLAVRVFKVPLASNDDGTGGGFETAPLIGSPRAIANAKDSLDYHWLQSQQFQFALTGLYALVSLLSLMAWLRDRRQRLLFWMMVFTFTPPLQLFLNGMRLPYSSIWLTFFQQTAIQVREVSQWYLLLYLLALEERPGLMRFVKVISIGTVVIGTLDGALAFFFAILGPHPFQVLDAILTFFILPFEALPIFLVIFAVVRRRRLDSARWIVASIAMVNDVLYAVTNISTQGVRFTHLRLSSWLSNLHLTLFGSVLPLQSIFRTALFLAIIYAVLRYAHDYRQRQITLEREFQNAREVQQVLVPEALPAIAGFALASAYQPAREVGGDFFQILPTTNGGALIVIGDVSGKGMPAAMTVSLLVGTMRTLAHYTESPGEILAAMNYRMMNRSNGGFTTCLVVRVDPDGRLTIANAGHLAPYVDGHEISVENGLPLGLEATASYAESSRMLGASQQLTLLTDGVVEARARNGELYGFHRTAAIATRSAEAISLAAREFGQEDDITVLTLRRVMTKEALEAETLSPAFSPSPA